MIKEGKGERSLKAHEITRLAAIFDGHSGLSTLVDDFERPMAPQGSEEEDS
jgi:hypothetical protein